MVEVKQMLLPKGTKARPGIVMKPEWITVHNTGNASKGADALAHAKYANSADSLQREVSYHYVCDDREIYQLLPTNEIGYHAGDGSGDGNMRSIGIEICMNVDGDIRRATENAEELIARIILEHDISLSCVVQHHHWTGKNCPQMIRARKPYGWEEFICSIMKIRDMLEVAPWAKDAWMWCKERGFMDGSRPKDKITREEVSTLLMRYDVYVSTVLKNYDLYVSEILHKGVDNEEKR